MIVTQDDRDGVTIGITTSEFSELEDTGSVERTIVGKTFSISWIAEKDEDHSAD